MMFHLVLNVSFCMGYVRPTDGKGAVAALPREILRSGRLFFHPFAGFGFRLLNQFGNRILSAQLAKYVDMILVAVDHDRGRIDIVSEYRRHVLVQTFAQIAIFQPRSSILRRVHHMDDDIRYRLSH